MLFCEDKWPESHQPFCWKHRYVARFLIDRPVVIIASTGLIRTQTQENSPTFSATLTDSILYIIYNIDSGTACHYITTLKTMQQSTSVQANIILVIYKALALSISKELAKLLSITILQSACIKFAKTTKHSSCVSKNLQKNIFSEKAQERYTRSTNYQKLLKTTTFCISKKGKAFTR